MPPLRTATPTSHRTRVRIRLAIGALAAATGALVALAAGPALAEDFDAKLARVDAALRQNPGRVTEHALDSCQRQRNHAARLFGQNQVARAERSLEYCFQVLRVSPMAPESREVAGPTIAEVQANAAREVERALALEPDLENGLRIYRSCAECHTAEGWGLRSGMVPQIAGQHRQVVIKQLADIRAGNREAVLMAPYATVEAIGGVQAVADVAGYIDTLEISADNGKGPGDRLALGEKLYADNCARCHGAAGEGAAASYVPRIQAQHYDYLVRQFQWIREGKRRNANEEMRQQIAGFDDERMRAVLDYVSRLAPPPEFQAPPGWHNPDFAKPPEPIAAGGDTSRAGTGQ
jgi:cytochrome c553